MCHGFVLVYLFLLVSLLTPCTCVCPALLIVKPRPVSTLFSLCLLLCLFTFVSLCQTPHALPLCVPCLVDCLPRRDCFQLSYLISCVLFSRCVHAIAFSLCFSVFLVFLALVVMIVSSVVIPSRSFDSSLFINVLVANLCLNNGLPFCLCPLE